VEVAFLVANYAPSVGGAQELTRRVAEGLVARGHRVTVVTTDAVAAPGGPNPGRLPVGTERSGGVVVERLPVARRFQAVLRRVRSIGARLGRPITPSVPSYGPWGAALARAAWRATRSADVVVGVSAPFTTLPMAAAASARGATGFVALPLLHLDRWSPGAGVVVPLRRADRCVALTAAEAAWMVDHGVPAERVCVVPPGCSDPVAPPGRPPAAARARLGLPERPTVAFVGRLGSTKGLDTLLEACATLMSRNARVGLLIAGSRTGWQGLDDLLDAADAAYPGRVVLRDGFTTEERGELLAAADVVVFPTREESFGIAVLEAWAARRPVVASDIGALRSLVRPGMDAELVAVDDPVALGTALADLLDDPGRAARLADGGAERVAVEFDWDVLVRRWEAILADAVAARRPVTAGAH
jgi:glycosyltransferase involved in cell wall biosynthesis